MPFSSWSGCLLGVFSSFFSAPARSFGASPEGGGASEDVRIAIERQEENYTQPKGGGQQKEPNHTGMCNRQKSGRRATLLEHNVLEIIDM